MSTFGPDTFRLVAKQSLGDWMGDQINEAMFKAISGAAIEPGFAHIRKFEDKGEGWTFTPHEWNLILNNGERERFLKDAVAHRDEALRRRVICRMEGLAKEADHWLASQRFFENNFKLEPV